MEDKINFIEENSIFTNIIGTTFVLLGLILLMSLSFQAAVFFILGFKLLNEKGFEFDKKTKKYRLLHNYFFITIGKWKSFENFEYISVFSTTERFNIGTFFNHASLSTKVIKLNVFYDSNKKVTVYKTKDLDEAYKISKQIANFLNIGLFDASDKHNAHWLIKTNENL